MQLHFPRVSSLLRHHTILPHGVATRSNAFASRHTTSWLPSFPSPPPLVSPFTTTTTTTKAAAADAGSGNNTNRNTTTTTNNNQAAFTNLERLITDTLGSGGPGGDWKEVEGSWVLHPPQEIGNPTCLIHFTGGAFVGAAPQLAYAPLLEALAQRGALVVATPYPTSFDHLRTADEVYFKLSRCLKSLGPSAQALPAYGLGHSLGSLVQLLICSRYVVPRAGNAYMSFNNRPATDSIPFLSPFIAPSARALGPLLSQLATSPLRSGVEQWIEILKGISPAGVRQIVPVLEQLTPIFLDVTQGVQEFSPSPEESRSLIKTGYAVNRNLLLKFADDTIDETPTLASVLQSSAVASTLELTVKNLPGDHVRPLQQDLNRISPDLARFTTQRLSESESFWNSIGSIVKDQTNLPDTAKEQLGGLVKAASGVTSLLGGAMGASDAGQNIDELADEIGRWMGLGNNKQRGTMMLPPPPTAPPTSAGN